jgi:hypothetical protein
MSRRFQLGLFLLVSLFMIWIAFVADPSVYSTLRWDGGRSYSLLLEARKDKYEKLADIKGEIARLDLPKHLPERAGDLARLKSLRDTCQKELEELDEQIRKQNSKHELAHVAFRAMALDALGGFASYRWKTKRTSFRYGEAYISMGLGAFSAVIFLGLFLTGQISVFPSGQVSTSARPEPWRVSALCLVAGTLHDRLQEFLEQVWNLVVGIRGSSN